jgi:hypothetical protein
MTYPHGGKYSNDPYYLTEEEEQRLIKREQESLCEDCPPIGYPTDKTRCAACPRRI